MPKPYEVETGELAAPPPRHDPLLLGPLVQRCVTVEDGAIVVAGAKARIRGDESPKKLAARLRLAIMDRFMSRRPNADAATWESFLVRAAAGVRDSAPTEESELEALLTHTIDGL